MTQLTEASPPDIHVLRSDVDRLITIGKVVLVVAGLATMPLSSVALLMWKNDGRQDDRIARLEEAQASVKVDAKTILERLDSIKTSVVEVKERVIRLESRP